MRIDQQIPTTDQASRAPDRVRAESLAGFGGLFSLLGEIGVQGGPEGIASAATREMSDPLGLATAEAAVSTGGPGAVAADAAKRATDTGPIENRPAAQRESAGSEPHRTAAPSSQRAPTADARHQNAGEDANSGTKQAAQPIRGEAAAAPTGTPAVPAVAKAQGARPVGAVGAAQATTGGTGVAQAVPAAPSSGIGALPGGPGAGAAKFGALMKQNATPQPQVLRGEEAQVAPQIAKGLASLVLKDGGTAQIQLRPEALGRVDVALTVRDGVVNATMSAENETARDLLGRDLDRLRALLEQRGLRVERLEISPGADGRDAQTEPGEGRGGRWMPAQDEPRGFGTDADGRSPWSGDRERAWGGGPDGRAERGGPDDGAVTAETGGAQGDGGDGGGDRRRPTVLSVRLDTVA